MNATPIRVLGCTLALIAAAGLAGCGGKDAASFVESAKSFIAKADYKAAIIEIKNALQKDPENGEARLLLAQSLLETGDAVGAETEARKAIAVGVAKDRTYPLLAHALVAQGEYAKAAKELETLRLDSAGARAELAVALATGYAAQGKFELASTTVDGALAEQPDNVRALLLKALLVGQSRDLADVRKYIDAALKISPDNVDALLMKAQLELGENHRDSAQALLEQAIAAHPKSIAVRAALVSLAATAGKLDVAKAQVAKMKEIRPRDFRTIYADALVAFAGGDNAAAHESIVRLLAARPGHLPSLLLSGLVDLQLHSYASAEEALRTVIKRAPDDSIAPRFLAALYLRTGRAPLALETLDPVLKRAPDNPLFLRMAGEAYLATGEAKLAAGAYERANAIDKGNVASQVRLAQVRFATGDTTRAFNELEALSASESSTGQADLALFAAHLSRREFDKALAIVDTLEKKRPMSALPSQLRGIVYFAKRDLKNARSSFEKALEIQPDFASAAASLALMDIQDGKMQAARDRYDRLLAKNPKNEQILLASAELMTVTGVAPDQVRSAFDKVVSANPTSTRARAARINYDLRRRDGKGALAAAQSALAAIPDDPELLDLLATAQLMNGDANQAVDALKRLVALQPQNPMVLLRLAEVETAVKDYSAAIQNERKALSLKPDLPQAWAAVAKTYVASGRPEAAIAEARKLQKEHPDKALGYALEAEILVTQKKWLESATVLRTALSRQPTPGLAVRLYVVLQAAGKTAEAVAMADKWMKEHPEDATLPHLIAQQDQQRKAYGAAIGGYERVLAIEPGNVAALNNLAWILTEQNNPKGVEYAEQAHRLAPMNPSVLDTLGWSLTRNGEPKRGAELLRMAASLAPGQNDIRLHLAKALVEAGDKAAARQTLMELSKLDKDSPIRAEAERLLTTL